MKKNKSSLSAGLMMEAWQEDGRTIGKLRLAERYLAERLAEAGLRPEGGDGQESDVEHLALAWIQAADVDAAMTYEMTGRTGA